MPDKRNMKEIESKAAALCCLGKPHTRKVGTGLNARNTEVSYRGVSFS